ncbi:AAA family ATPase [Roseivivax sediminis]|uniref:AAA domain-containing protein, putative AbiEii toxin, Type IV TA system n=1 Tax=Roseivivax sediminis TaxID=936889 RepID=A0A1I1ZNY8_9RHOB|nr:AAA family ATPase [Roseivivax sediminis]SFE33401.1 AAA domain-containing protein, putative AbiEii toxin, Type IV TA system [Roseivivax sediminis]
MTFQVGFQDFRGFQQQRGVPIRPLTVLVGENSAGKTSFLAGLKYLLDFLSLDVIPTFNGDPFQLGTYDQIAHFRGGRGGRARDFRISGRFPVVLDGAGPQRSSRPVNVDVSMTFARMDSQAGISSIRFSAQRRSLLLSIVSDKLRIEYFGAKGIRRQVGDSSSYPSSFRSDLARYWPFVLQDLNFRIGLEAESGFDLSDEEVSEVERIVAAALAISNHLPNSVSATSAIRTRPQRTYTPGVESEDSDGTHVPFEIAKLYRSRSRSDSSWGELKSALEEFGRNSDMFSEILVKSFGQTASDPFQIQFSHGGPRTNLVDLGYGTSQVLPIVYSVATAGRSSKFLVQQPEVHLHPKAQAALGQYFVDSFKENNASYVLETHSDFIVDRIRRSVMKGEIDSGDVAILFFERFRLENKITLIELSAAGEPVNAPAAYRDFFIDEQMKNLGL